MRGGVNSLNGSLGSMGVDAEAKEEEQRGVQDGTFNGFNGFNGFEPACLINIYVLLLPHPPHPLSRPRNFPPSPLPLPLLSLPLLSPSSPLFRTREYFGVTGRCRRTQSKLT